MHDVCIKLEKPQMRKKQLKLNTLIRFGYIIANVSHTYNNSYTL